MKHVFDRLKLKLALFLIHSISLGSHSQGFADFVKEARYAVKVALHISAPRRERGDGHLPGGEAA